MDTTRASLILRVKLDPGAWSEFDSIYRPLLTRYAAARGLSASDAEDIVQECMAAIHKHIGGFDYDPKKGRFKSWLRTLVNNRCRNWFRHRRENQADTAAFVRPQERELEPDEQFERIWLQEHLRHCLMLLEQESDAATFKAYRGLVVEGMTVEEIGREFDLTPNQVYKLRWRLTGRVKELMRELIGEEETEYERLSDG